MRKLLILLMAFSSLQVLSQTAAPAAKKRFAELGALLLPGSAADFGKLLADETEKWGKVVRFAGVKVD